MGCSGFFQKIEIPGICEFVGILLSPYDKIVRPFLAASEPGDPEAEY